MTRTSKHPLDFDQINPGDYITADEIDEALGIERSHSERWSMLLKLQKQVEAELAQRNIFVRVRQHRLGLRVLDPLETSEYSEQSFFKHIRALKKDARYIALVDSSKFDDKQSRDHDMRIARIGTLNQWIQDEAQKTLYATNDIHNNGSKPVDHALIAARKPIEPPRSSDEENHRDSEEDPR